MTEKSKDTKFIEAINELMSTDVDQYKATAYVMDAVFGTADYCKLEYKTLRGAKGNLQKAFNVSSLFEYVQAKQLKQIEPFLAGLGDVVILRGESNEHDDIAFCAGTKWVYFNDEDQLLRDRFYITDFNEADLVAFRLT